MKEIEQVLKEKNFVYVSLMMIIMLGVILAVVNHSIIDDAYISFRYSENFVEGNGLVFNEGEYVEGYSNFLWVLIMSFFMFFGISPILISKILGIFFFASSILFKTIPVAVV